ncbi:MAG: hypothetical protein KBD56_04660 [Candidatus Eisenbacteria bacterium]|nr:hypothetical protein [Candidatus Eisenbacteria bacterium]
MHRTCTSHLRVKRLVFLFGLTAVCMALDFLVIAPPCGFIVPTAMAEQTPLRLTDPLGGTGGGQIAGSITVRIVQAGTSDPVPNAFVMVGPRPGRPFANNWMMTGADGLATFVSSGFTGPVDVTAGAAGYRYFTIVGVDARELVLPLRPLESSTPEYQVGDRVDGIDVNNGMFHLGDGYFDFAIVIPTARGNGINSIDTGMEVARPETLDVLNQQMVVPSNIYVPQQWETLIEIVKEHYYIFLTPGEYTLTAMSGRVATSVLLEGGDWSAILNGTSWREIDVRDITVTGPTSAADLLVDPDLTDTVTMNLANVPAGSATVCLSAGDLDHLEGLGRLAPMGLRSFSCADGGACAGAVSLCTTPAVGEFANTGYMALAMVDMTSTNDALVVADRGPHPPAYTTTLSSFFQLLDPACASGVFTWNDVTNPEAGSPPVHLCTASIGDTAQTVTYWELMAPGDRFRFTLPALPAQAPPAPAAGELLLWTHTALGLGYNLPAFDYNAFAFSDVNAHATHASSDLLTFELVYDPQGISPGEAREPRLLLSVASSNPFRDRARIRFTLDRKIDVGLAVYDIEGRRVAGLWQGPCEPGEHEVVWTGTDAQGSPVASGVYWARLTADGATAARAIVLRR